MGWAALIPVAASVLSSMSKSGEQQPQQQGQAPPTLGEIFAMNSKQNELPPQMSNPFAPSPIIKTGGGFNG